MNSGILAYHVSSIAYAGPAFPNVRRHFISPWIPYCSRTRSAISLLAYLLCLSIHQWRFFYYHHDVVCNRRVFLKSLSCAHPSIDPRNMLSCSPKTQMPYGIHAAVPYPSAHEMNASLKINARDILLECGSLRVSSWISSGDRVSSASSRITHSVLTGRFFIAQFSCLA